MAPAQRKALLAAHVVSSVGWIGAVAAFLSLALAGRCASPGSAAGIYSAMDTIGLTVIIPASLLAVVTGIVQALGTPWGLLRYRWVATKLVLGLLATAALLLHQFTAVAGASRRASAGVPVGSLASQLVVDAALAILVLVVATVLSIYKPWGMTRYGQRRRDASTRAEPLPRSARLGVVVGCVLVLAFVILHLLGHGFHHGG